MTVMITVTVVTVATMFAVKWKSGWYFPSFVVSCTSCWCALPLDVPFFACGESDSALNLWIVSIKCGVGGGGGGVCFECVRAFELEPKRNGKSQTGECNIHNITSPVKQNLR